MLSYFIKQTTHEKKRKKTKHKSKNKVNETSRTKHTNSDKKLSHSLHSVLFGFYTFSYFSKIEEEKIRI